MKSWLFGLALAAVAVAPGTRTAQAGSLYELLQLDQRVVKWGAPEIGTGARVSYGVVATRSRFAGARNCREMDAPGAMLAASGVSPAAFRAEVEAAFAMWERVADIEFVRVDDPAQAQILIGAETAARGNAFANVQYRRDADAARSDIASIHQSLVCLNPERPWKVGFGGDPAAYDLRYTLAHEIGHAIGLDHPAPDGQLMAFTYQERFRSLQDGDIAGAVALYGQRPARTTVAGVGKTPVAFAPASVSER